MERGGLPTGVLIRPPKGQHPVLLKANEPSPRHHTATSSQSRLVTKNSLGYGRSFSFHIQPRSVGDIVVSGPELALDRFLGHSLRWAPQGRVERTPFLLRLHAGDADDHPGRLKRREMVDGLAGACAGAAIHIPRRQPRMLPDVGKDLL